MRCPSCGNELGSSSSRCPACGYTPDAAATGFASSTPTGFTPTASGRAAGAPGDGPLIPGQPFGPRYHVIRVLGAGGMGVVYHAWDGELGVAVALKVIRPEVLSDPGSAKEVERRFKRELVLARQVTHKNVVRIHDLGELNGVKYLTMPFVQGDDLASVLKREGKIPVPRALAIAKQVASGLAAAHEVGVVHRDLKPENIMIQADGDALIMDFGISRSVSASTGTATQMGAVLGTLEYMAPEQAEGAAVDHRADIYSFGLVVYDMLTGRQRLALRDNNAMSEMMSRMQEPPPRLRELDGGVPEAFERIIMRCLEPSREARYQATPDLVRDLDALTADGHLLRPALVAPPVTKGISHKGAAPALALVVAIAVSGWWMLRKASSSSGDIPTEPISVLIANFDNHANDEQFEGLIEQALAVGIEGTSFITAFPRRDALRAARQIAPEKPLNEEVARLVSTREGIDRIVAGAISYVDGKYQLELRVLDPSLPTALFGWKTNVPSKNEVLAAVGQGAAEVRGALGDTSAGGGDAETFTAASIEAAHAYAKAQELSWAGANEKALAEYQRAIQLDPQFGRAFSGLAALHFNAGQRERAIEYYKLALQNTDRMTERERLRTRGAYYLVIRNLPKANEELQALVQKYPADTAALANLAVNRVYERRMSDALELGQRAAAIYPKNVIRRNNVALFAMYAGDFTLAATQARTALDLNPEYPKAHVALAMSQLGQGLPRDAEKSWRRLEEIPAGRMFAAAGLADLAMFEGRVSDAARVLDNDKTGLPEPRRLALLGEVLLLQGNQRDAATNARAAAAVENADPAVLFLAGRILAELRHPQAAAVAAALASEIDVEPQIFGALLLGEIALAQQDHRAAVARFTDAQNLGDTWLGRFGLGRAQLAAGRYPEAESEFDKCLSRRGEATAVFLDEIPTYRLVAPVYYYMGLVREGLKNPRGAADSFRTFLEIKKDGDEQGLAADARRRRLNQ